MNTLQEILQESLYFNPLPVERFSYMAELESIASYANRLQTNVENASMFYYEMERFFLEKLSKLKNEACRKKLVYECLRNKGIVPKLSKETQIKYLLDIFNAEFRWYQLLESKDKKSLKYQRFNPERGKIKKRQKSPCSNENLSNIKKCNINITNDFKINETIETSSVERLCRQCNYLCPIVTRSFCSLSCLHLYKIRSRSNYVRRCLFIRDKGICDLCGLNTEKIRYCIHKFLRQLTCDAIPINKKEFLHTLHEKLPLKVHNLRFTRRGTIPRGCFWHADHILAVSQGGGNALLDNYRTLCVSCHQNMTRLLRSQPRILKCKKKIMHPNKNMLQEEKLLNCVEASPNQNESSLLQRVKLQHSQREKSSSTTSVREKLHELLLIKLPCITKEKEDKKN